jgi:hypothetical protein
MDGFLQRPTVPAANAGVTSAAANTFPDVDHTGGAVTPPV